MVISESQLEQLSRTELIALVKVLLTQIASLETRVAEWKAKLPPGAPPATPPNSSQPPPRDQKSNLLAPKGAKRIGAKPGHVAATRPLAEKPDRIIEVKADRCANCHTDLRDCEPTRVLRHCARDQAVWSPTNNGREPGGRLSTSSSSNSWQLIAPSCAAS
jgi:hypothetical protein